MSQVRDRIKRTGVTAWRVIDAPWPAVRLAIIRLALRDLRTSYGDLLEPRGERLPWRWDGPVTRMRYALMPRRMLLQRHFAALDEIERLREGRHD